MNMNKNGGESRIAEYFKILGSPFRIQILYIIGYGEACVCHLETVLNKRQAFISQHLMVMRDAGILDTRRDGKYIYYRAANRDLFEILESAADILNLPENSIPKITETKKHVKCDCPHCIPEPVPSNK